MLNDDYLKKGLTALSRAGSKSAMAGHTGAAVIAAYFFCRENQLEPQTQSIIRQHVDALIENGSIAWYPEAQSPTERGALFSPYPAEPHDLRLQTKILSALDGQIGELKESGHCTIFASLALKALREMPSMSTPAIVGGICQLIDRFTGSGNRGYYGKEKGWMEAPAVEPEKHLSPYESIGDVVHAAFGELVIHDKTRRQGYGGLVHLITHTNALYELTEMGYQGLAQKGYVAHQTHILLLRSLPPLVDEDDSVVSLVPTKQSPLSYDYWTKVTPTGESASGIGLGGIDHILKVNYAFFHLIPSIKENQARDEYMRQLGYVT